MRPIQLIKKFLLYAVSIALVSVLMILIFTQRKGENKEYTTRDYRQILNDGVLNVVTEYNAISFFVDDDSIRGFDYELINEFARSKELKINITPEMSFEKRLRELSEGKFDIIAISTPITTNLKDSFLFTNTLLIGKQILVQRKESKTDTSYVHIKNQLDLAGKTIHIIKDSPAATRIKNLMTEIADTIYVKEISDYGTEQLMAMVDGGDIEYAVCDENIANAYIENFPNIDINTDISFNQFYSWIVSKDSPELLDSINSWLNGFMKTREYKKLYNKYYK